MKRLAFLLLFCSLIYGGVEDYFKKAANKSDGHQIRNIDFIYMINLDQRPEKFAKSMQQLSFYGIEPYRFSAVNGWELSLPVLNDVGVRYESWMSMEKWGTYYETATEQHEIVQEIGRNYFCHCMSRGAVGIALSHLSILQDAYDSGYERIWVMEDDIDIVRDPHCLSEMIDQLDQLVGKGEWDILFTDPDTKNGTGAYVPCYGYAWRPNYFPPNPEIYSQRNDVGTDFRRVGARYGAYSMIIQRSGMKKILDFIKQFKIFLPYDMDFSLPHDIRLYTLRYDVVSTQPNAISDNGLPKYLKKPIPSISFEASMENSYRYDPVFAKEDENWQIFKSAFDSYQQNDSVQEEYIIPKLIHFIWLGSPLPQRCEKMVDSWKKFHPDWVVRVWTDQDVEGFGMRNQLAFDFADNYGEKSDIFRYEILYRYGGLYIDTDFECLKPFDDVHKSCAFYTGATYDKEALVYNGLIGTKPGHPILKACVENTPISKGDNDTFRILSETGPYFLSKMIFESESFEEIVVFPITYLYPYPNNVSLGEDSDAIKKTFVRPESMAIHYWDVSWAK